MTIIPQTVEQARQRDHIANRPPAPLVDPAIELAALHQAVAQHERDIRELDHVPASEFQTKAQDLLAKRRQVDLELWQRIPESARP